ncbi:helix-turn-helix domain-containing protein [Frateuria sp. MAH-13]|uniref:Helix-turn-helix domain-containing protein n=1 Tax=Frateuria flava TaxID=2821489 RepID=A0ABS4DIB2_9GAMM|nr:helix-turn-helix domain-containing protein [Frateuria flava]MBP1472783.1 helix-turn-helix domain-containing protein [Frateuria flava]
MKWLDIAEVARRTGLPPSTLRFYEAKGLITSVGRHGLRRMFGPDVLERLALVTLGRSAGFALDDLAGLFKSGGKPRIDREQLAAKADELDRTIRRLAAVREGLRHASTCPAPSHLECPRFQRLLRVATANQVRHPTKASPRRKTPPRQ